MAALRLFLRPITRLFGGGVRFTTRAAVKKPQICTADELHYVTVSNSDWKLALWRYLPSSKGPSKNHPLLLLSGVGANAIGYDLSPESSFARIMSGEGFDTWILEVRGAGLSAHKGNSDSDEGKTDLVAKSKLSRLNIAKSLMQLSHRLTDYFGEGRFSTHFQDFIKQFDLTVKYDWDFDHYLEEDIPAVMEYIKTECKPKDGKLSAIGHSMGGILLYAMLSLSCFKGREPGFKSVATLGSSLDYTSSKSSLKLLLPLADPAKALNIPVIPLGVLLAAMHPIVTRAPYVLSWLNSHISAPGMMQPRLFEKLVLTNFCTIPSKLLLQLTTAFREGGLRDRKGTFFYKDHLSKTNVPILAIAGDRDLICPPEAVNETVKVIPEHLVTYKVFGEFNGPHFAHYDLVGGQWAVDQVYPCLVNFLNKHD